MVSHKELLHMYFLRTESELEDAVHEYTNRIRLRSHDAVDFLELMLAEERLKNFLDFRRDVLALLRIELKENGEKCD